MTTPACETQDPRLFWSPNVADHRQAAIVCDGCPALDWCRTERDKTAEINGRTSIDGTWAGELWVNGVLSPEGRRRPGRPRKVRAA